MTTRRSILRGLLGAVAAPVVAKVATDTPPPIAAPAPAPVPAPADLSAIAADLGDIWPLRIQSPDRLFWIDFRTGEAFIADNAIEAPKLSV